MLVIEMGVVTPRRADMLEDLLQVAADSADPANSLPNMGC
jgi:hypothetical protein